MKKSIVLILSMIFLLGLLCGCTDSTSYSDDDSYSEDYSENYDEGNANLIYDYDFTGAYYNTSFSLSDEKYGFMYDGLSDEEEQEMQYQIAMAIRQGDYDSVDDLEEDFYIVDEYTADVGNTRYSVEIDKENYTLKMISPFGEIEYFDIIEVDDDMGFMLLNHYSDGDFYQYCTKATYPDE